MEPITNKLTCLTIKKMRVIIRYIVLFIILAFCTSACQSTKFCYLHFRDNKTDMFYTSDTLLVKSIDTCFIINDTLCIVLKAPIKTKANNREYYYAFRKPQKIYTEKLPTPDYYLRHDISYVMINNYYCTRYFRRKYGFHYFQVASTIFSSPFCNTNLEKTSE